jgi:hypothetical protein
MNRHSSKGFQILEGLESASLRGIDANRCRPIVCGAIAFAAMWPRASLLNKWDNSLKQVMIPAIARTRKNSQLAAARRVALKMGRRLSRACGIGYRSIQICALLTPVRLGPPCRRPILNATTSSLYARRCTKTSPRFRPAWTHRSNKSW